VKGNPSELSKGVTSVVEQMLKYENNFF
jgi:hypothetical protein